MVHFSSSCRSVNILVFVTMSLKFAVLALLVAAAAAVVVPDAPCTACEQVHMLRSRVKMLETQIMELNTLAIEADGEETLSEFFFCLDMVVFWIRCVWKCVNGGESQ